MRKSPFPGMDPWLESHWGDMHTSMTTYARDQLQPQLPAGLRARVEEYVAVAADDDNVPEERRQRYRPDVHVWESRGGPEPESAGGVAVVEQVDVARPLVVRRRAEPETLRSLQILDTQSGNRVVTSIEFLSPFNKLSRGGRREFLRKQRELLEGGVNLVEIDLLRGGPWVLSTDPQLVPREARDPYRICVVRAANPDDAEMYPVPLSAPLPGIWIPLRPDDTDVVLRLQPLFDSAYVNGGYDSTDYAQPPVPPLEEPHIEWAAAILQQRSAQASSVPTAEAGASQPAQDS